MIYFERVMSKSYLKINSLNCHNYYVIYGTNATNLCTYNIHHALILVLLTFGMKNIRDFFSCLQIYFCIDVDLSKTVIFTAHTTIKSFLAFDWQVNIAVIVKFNVGMVRHLFYLL